MNREEMLKLEKEEIITLLFAIIQQQAEKIAELEARLNQNSKNSSNPPSSDKYKKPKSMRKTSEKKAGGQPGHEGSGLTMTQTPDFGKIHEPAQCARCDKAGVCPATKYINETRYEIDIEIKPIVTAHQTLWGMCPRINEIITGEFPAGMNSTVQYGVNLEALAISLNTIGMVSINRTHEILNGVFGVPISTGTIAGMIKDCAQSVSGTVSDIEKAIVEEPVVHYDETGTRVDKRMKWAHVASSDTLTYISVEEKRGRAGMDSAGILPGYSGTGIHDCWGSYFSYHKMRHGLCCAHLLRELTAVTENHRQEWAQKLSDLLIGMKHAKEALILQDQQEAPPHLLERYSRAYDAILIEAQAANPVLPKDPTKKGRPKRGKVGALVDRLALRKENILLFFWDFSVPFDNNQAERDFRMFKVKQKVSGCFRTDGGADDFAAIMSFVGTARKRGISAFLAIRDALLGFPFSLKLPVATE